MYHFNKHVWDVQPQYYPIQRKFVMAIETTFCVASGLVKVSVLLFYKRLGSRAVSNTFRWATRATIAFIVAYSIAFTLVPIFGCQPISAFWDQSDIIKVAMGYKYKCFNEGADVFAAAVISSAQDLLTAILPTFLYWNLQIPVRQKIALFGIFAIGYGVVAMGAVRSYYSWQIFFETYDVTWVTWQSFTWSLLEIHIGAICANAPALKVFFRTVLRIKSSSAGSGSNSKNSDSKNFSKKPGNSSSSRSTYSKVSVWRSNQQYRQYGHISEPVTELMGSHEDVSTREKVQDVEPSTSKRSSLGAEVPNSDDIELGIFRNPSETRPLHSARSNRSSQESFHALPRMPSPYPAARLPPSNDYSTSFNRDARRKKRAWQSWS